MNGIITFCGVYLVFASLALVGYLFFKLDKKSRKKFAVQIILAGGLALLIARVCSTLYTNPRPFVNDGVQALFYSSANNGFPSDHTLLAATLAFSAFIYSRKLGVVLLVLATLVAWGRVAGNVHHGIDVVVSFAIAGGSVLIVNKIITQYYLPKKNSHHKKTEI